MEKIRLSHPGDPIRGKIKIGGSKSISNRILLLNALAAEQSPISNLSDSDDTVTMQKLLSSTSQELDAHHAGTTFRFMTAYLCLQDGTQVLTGSDRMKQRPVGPLVEALIELGADIIYLENDGYPPLQIGDNFVQKTNTITIKADMSSQFISALCMIAPKLPHGLTINLEGDLVSKPYLEMTLKLMEIFGVASTFKENSVSISAQSYISCPYTVESDWSSASYHYAIAAIAEDAQIELSHFKQDSVQADSVIQSFSERLGVKSKLIDNSLHLESLETYDSEIVHDFITHPDIAQTIAGIAAAKNITVFYKGLKTLAIKETDRVVALKKELAKLGVKIEKDTEGKSEYRQAGKANLQLPEFETYQDHRMAMALAPLALVGPVEIINPKVVNKSYPNFWTDLKSLGFIVESA